jgi:hypothetical protein
LIIRKNEQDEITKQLANGSGDAAAPVLVETSCLVHILPSDIPEYVIYNGMKFIPENKLNESDRSNVELKIKLNELTQKV